MKPLGDIIVVGTDTGVGKSVVSLLLMQLLFACGYSPFYLKPFQTGCHDSMDVDSDARFVYEHTKELQQADPAQSVIYCHQNPKAPYFAARDAGQSIDADFVLQVIEQKRRLFSPLVIEAAGGLLVPIAKDLLVIDMIKQICGRPLLVAKTGLGTINHTLLSIEALQNRIIAPMGIVFSDGASAPSDPGFVAENIAAVEMFSSCRIAGVIPRLSNFDSPPMAAHKLLESILYYPAIQ
jgi:dethiobiotin synthetase